MIKIKKTIIEKDYIKCLNEIKEAIRSSQYEALKAVNKELINLYWNIGKIIIEKQKEHNWGASIVKNLSEDLQKEYPGIKGFSIQNLWYMRQFYFTYKDNTKLQPLVGEISWVKNVIIMSKLSSNISKYSKPTRPLWTKSVGLLSINHKSRYLITFVVDYIFLHLMNLQTN